MSLLPFDLPPAFLAAASRGPEWAAWVDGVPRIVRDLLDGKKGPVRDAVLLNAAGAMLAYDGPGDDIKTGLQERIARAAETIDSGAAADLLNRWATRSTELKAQEA